MPPLEDTFHRPTAHTQFLYQRTKKHHDWGTTDESCWLKDLSFEDEFAVFEAGADADVRDEDLHIYGATLDGDELITLGTCMQDVAKFPRKRDGEVWHGYPVWPVSGAGSDRLRDQRNRPPKAVLDRMVSVNMITAEVRKRLAKGDHN